jgi:hypothetical protein
VIVNLDGKNLATAHKATAHTAERYAQKQHIEVKFKSIQPNNEKENPICHDYSDPICIGIFNT